jgi:dipeptidyl aminopeptidase/acylaminoacyl peptidase
VQAAALFSLIAGCAAAPPVPTADRAVEAKAAAFVDAFTNSAPSPLADGRVVFVSTRDGLPTLYVADSKTAPPRRLLQRNERVGGYAILPGERALLFSSDVKSDENFSLFRADLVTGATEELTAGEKLHRNSPIVARNQPELFAYSAHAQSDRATRLFVRTREVYKDPSRGYLADFSPEGDRLLFIRFVSENEQVVLLVDAATGKAARAYPPEGAIKLSAAAFSADGKGLFVARQDPGRPARLLLLDAATLAERAAYEEASIPTATIAEIAVSPAGDRAAFIVDAGNRSELRIADARSLHLLGTAKTGLGVARGMRFRADGAQLAVSFSSPELPLDVVAIDPRTGDVERLREEARAGLSTPVARIEEIRAFDGLRIPVNVYLPAAASAKLPTLVLIHGGPSSSAPIRFNATIGFFSAMGFAVVEPNIRGSTGFGIDFEKADDREKRGDAVKDVESVNAWARAQPWCDGKRLAIGGISYGGYMTLLALTRQPSLWRAGIDGSGMSDLRTMERMEDQAIRAYDETEFGVLGKDDAILAEWSPLEAVDRISTPLFVYQGVHDPVTPQNEADQIVAALRKRNVPVEYMLVENEGHGLTRRENLVEYLARSFRFLALHLDLR